MTKFVGYNIRPLLNGAFGVYPVDKKGRQGIRLNFGGATCSSIEEAKKLISHIQTSDVFVQAENNE